MLKTSRGIFSCLMAILLVQGLAVTKTAAASPSTVTQVSKASKSALAATAGKSSSNQKTSDNSLKPVTKQSVKIVYFTQRTLPPPAMSAITIPLVSLRNSSTS